MAHLVLGQLASHHFEVSLNLRLKDLLGPVTRVKKKKKKTSKRPKSRCATHAVDYEPFIKSQLASR